MLIASGFRRNQPPGECSYTAERGKQNVYILMVEIILTVEKDRFVRQVIFSIVGKSSPYWLAISVSFLVITVFYRLDQPILYAVSRTD